MPLWRSVRGARPRPPRPAECRGAFRLALYDPNPNVARLAEKLAAGKGFSKVTWGLGPSHYGTT